MYLTSETKVIDFTEGLLYMYISKYSNKTCLNLDTNESLFRFPSTVSSGGPSWSGADRFERLMIWV